MSANEWKHCKLAWAPPYHPDESYWRTAGTLTLRIEIDGYSDASGERVYTGAPWYDARATVQVPERKAVLALVWCVEESAKPAWPARGRVLVSDYPSMQEALAAAKAQCEAAAAAHAAREVA